MSEHTNTIRELAEQGMIKFEEYALEYIKKVNEEYKQQLAEDILLSDYDLLKREYIKLKQQKQDLKEWLKEEIDNPWFSNNSYREQGLKEVLERLG